MKCVPTLKLDDKFLEVFCVQENIFFSVSVNTVDLEDELCVVGLEGGVGQGCDGSLHLGQQVDLVHTLKEYINVQGNSRKGFGRCRLSCLCAKG